MDCSDAQLWVCVSNFFYPAFVSLFYVRILLLWSKDCGALRLSTLLGTHFTCGCY